MTTAETLQGPPPQSRILVVDDSITVRRVVARTLERAGYEVLQAEDGRQALELAQHHVPDLLLVDVVMPHMDGAALCEALRHIANLRDVPVVLMSAKPEALADAEIERTGAVDAIRKPFGPEALLAVTGHALARLDELPSEPSGPAPTPEGPASDVPQRTHPADAPHITRLAAALAAVLRDSGAAGDQDGDLEARLTEALLAHPEHLQGLVDDLEHLYPDDRAAFAGRLEHVPLGDILQLLHHQRQTGVLQVQPTLGANADPPAPRQTAVRIFMSDGLIAIALGAGSDPEFRLGRYLMQDGLIERDDLELLLRNREADGKPLLGKQLVKLGYITADDLQQALVRQTSELLYDALRWHRGRYRFLRFAGRPDPAQAELGLPIASVLMEGLRRVDEWRLIEEQIRDFDQVLVPDPGALATTDIDRMSPEERTVLRAVDGQRTVREIITHTNMGSFEACKVLFQLMTSHLIRQAPG